MSNVIEIGVTIDELAQRQERVLKAKRFEVPDRVPVMPAIAHRFLVPQVGVSFRDYYNDPETMLRTQILAQKWLMEHVRTDAYAITGAWVGAWTDFQNTFEAGSLGCEVIFADDDIPWVGRPWVKTDEDLRTLEKMDYIRTGINARQLAYRKAMMEVAEQVPGPVSRRPRILSRGKSVVDAHVRRALRRGRGSDGADGTLRGRLYRARLRA